MPRPASGASATASSGRNNPNPAGAGDKGLRVGKGFLREIAAIAAGLVNFAAQNETHYSKGGGFRIVGTLNYGKRHVSLHFAKQNDI